MAHFVAAEKVAREFGLAIAICDRRTVRQSIKNRVLGKEKMMSLLGDTADVTIVAVPTIMQVMKVESDAAKSNSKRIGKSGRKRKEDGALPSN